jgi:hypothetical protein
MISSVNHQTSKQNKGQRNEHRLLKTNQKKKTTK